VQDSSWIKERLLIFLCQKKFEYFSLEKNLSFIGVTRSSASAKREHVKRPEGSMNRRRGS